MQGAVPWVPSAAVGLFDVQVDSDLADVVQQCGVGDGSSPGLGLRGLILWTGADGQQMRLPQLQAVGDDFQAVVKHAAWVSVVMRLGCRESLNQLGITFQRRAVQRSELLARERGALPDVFQQLLPARCRQQRCGRFRPDQSFREVGGGCRRWRGSDRRPFPLEQREHVGVLVAGQAGGLFAFSGRAFPLAPHSLAISALWPLEAFGYRAVGIGRPPSMWGW